MIRHASPVMVLLRLILIMMSMKGIKPHVVVSPEAGVVIEGTSVAVHAMEDVYHTLVYHVRGLTELPKTESCKWVPTSTRLSDMSKPLWDLLRGYEQLTISSVCASNPLLCGQTKESTYGMRRPRRFAGLVGMVAGFAGVGLALQNGVALHRLNDAVESLNRNQHLIRNFTSRQNQEMRSAVSHLEKMIFVQAEDFNLHIDRLHTEVCAMQQGYAAAFLSLSAKTSIQEAYAVVENAQNGMVDSRLVPRDAIREMVQPGGALRDTVYETDVDLFYAVTTSFFLGFNEHDGTISYLLQTPHLLKADISPIYDVYNYGFKDQNTKSWMKLDLPDQFFLLHDFNNGKSESAIPMKLDTKKCHAKASVVICRHSIPEISNQSNCLNDLLHSRQSEYCSVIIDPTIKELVIHPTPSVLVMRGVSSYNQITEIRAIPSSREITLNPHALVVLPYEDFSMITTHGHVVRSPKAMRGTLHMHQEAPELKLYRTITWNTTMISPRSPLHDQTQILGKWETRELHLEDIPEVGDVTIWDSIGLGLGVTAVMLAAAVGAHWGWKEFLYRKRVAEMKSGSA